MIIGITGSSGAGKSTVCELLSKKYNMQIINADEIAKELSKKGTDYIKDIVSKFGKDIVDENGDLRRKKLGEIIYTNDSKREELNSCTFKYIKKEIFKKIEKMNQDNIVIDAPLLFESELDKICDRIIGVISKKQLQIERIVSRDNIDYDHATMRLDAQQKDDFYIKKCDAIIENNHDIKQLEQQVEELACKWRIVK